MNIMDDSPKSSLEFRIIKTESDQPLNYPWMPLRPSTPHNPNPDYDYALELFALRPIPIGGGTATITRVSFATEKEGLEIEVRMRPTQP